MNAGPDLNCHEAMHSIGLEPHGTGPRRDVVDATTGEVIRERVSCSDAWELYRELCADPPRRTTLEPAIG